MSFMRLDRFTFHHDGTVFLLYFSKHKILKAVFWSPDYFWQLDRTSSSQSLKEIVTSTVRFRLKSIQMCGELWVPDNPQFQVTLYQQKGKGAQRWKTQILNSFTGRPIQLRPKWTDEPNQARPASTSHPVSTRWYLKKIKSYPLVSKKQPSGVIEREVIDIAVASPRIRALVGE